MGRKTQLEKFEARMSKKVSDEHAVNTKKYQKQQEEIEKYGITGVEMLKDKGGIKEAAAVFSLEGMNAFTKVFVENPLEGAVSRALTENMPIIMGSIEKVVERVVERKLVEMIEGMTLGIQSLSSSIESAVTKQVEKTLEETVVTEPVHMPKEITKEVKTNKVKYNIGVALKLEKCTLKVFSEEKVLTCNKTDLNIAVTYLRDIMEQHEGKEILSKDVVATLKKYYNVVLVNPTHAWSRAIEIDPKFSKIRRGYYMYGEKKI